MTEGNSPSPDSNFDARLRRLKEQVREDQGADGPRDGGPRSAGGWAFKLSFELAAGLVVGGGIIGLASAWRAQQRGLRVCVLERAEAGSGASRAAAGVLAPDPETPGFTALARASAELWPAFAEELGSYPSMVERLDEIACPVTVIVGENDTGLRASADTLATGIAGAELIVIPDAGHSPQEDQPDAWTAAVLAHLARVPRV